MADTSNGQNQLGPPAEPSTEKRLLLAFLLMGAVLFLTPYFYRLVMPQQAAKPTAPQSQTAKETPKPAPAAAPEAVPAKPPGPAAKAAPAGKAAPAAQVSADHEAVFVVETKLYRVVLSNRGALVRSWTLKDYKDFTGKPLELVSAAGTAKAGYPFALAFPGKVPSTDVNQALYAARPSPDGLGIDYEYASGGLAVHKSFRFEKNSYLSQVSTEVTENGTGVPNLIAWRGGFGDAAGQNEAASQRCLFFDLASGKLVTREAKAAKDGPATDTGNYSFAGLEDAYFAAAFLPQNGSAVQVRTVADNVMGADNKEQSHVGAQIGGGGASNQFAVFVGPKDMDVLRKVDPRLEQLVDFGFWSFLAKPLFIIVNWTNDHTVRNYGWAIVLVTIGINTVLLPLRLTSMKSMKKMQTLQPQVAAINAKYKNVGLRDPRKAEQNQEVMDLYKKHGVNPMGGCFPMLIQIPFFFAFYKVLTVAIEMRGASWLWVTDLSRPETLAIHVLPILMIAAQFVQQKMTPNPSADPNQQKMMLMMPLIFGFMFYSVSSGLVLYWLTSNVVGIVQQWFINRSMPAPAPSPAEPVAAGKKRSGIRR
jgi:YidC/Oxa1 family membrane protein insertase